MCYVTCRSRRVFIMSHIRMIFGIYFTSHLACRLNRTLPLKLLHRLWALSPPGGDNTQYWCGCDTLSPLHWGFRGRTTGWFNPRETHLSWKTTPHIPARIKWVTNCYGNGNANKCSPPTTWHAFGIYTTTFYGHPPPSTMETKRTWNLNKTISGKPPPCPPGLYLLRTNKRAPSILIKRNMPGKVGKLYLLC